MSYAFFKWSGRTLCFFALISLAIKMLDHATADTSTPWVYVGSALGSAIWAVVVMIRGLD